VVVDFWFGGSGGSCGDSYLFLLPPPHTLFFKVFGPGCVFIFIFSVGGSFAFAAAILNVYAAVVYQTCCKDFVDSEAVGGMEWRGTDGKSASNPMTNDPPAVK
jgi:hypothetical protein